MSPSRSSVMQLFRYSITDLTTYASEPMEIALEREEALEFGLRMAREVLIAMPNLGQKGMCVAVYDKQGESFSIVPLDPLQ